MANKYLRDDFEIGCRFGYHCQPSFDWNEYILRNNSTDKSQIIGFELETGCKKPITAEMYETIVGLYPVICESDGSILGNSSSRDYIDEVEIISQPMTMNYFYAHLGDLKKLFTYLKENSFGSHDLGSCGLHIHFQRPETEDELKRVVSRLWLIQESYKTQIIKIDGRGWVHYADNLANHYGYDTTAEHKSLDWLAEGALDNTGTHTLAINLQHANDIEIRSPRGTLNFETFVARIEFWYNAYTESLRDQRISRLTWNKLMSGKYIRKYCMEHDAVTFATLVDTTAMLKDYYEKVIKYNNTVLKYTQQFITNVTTNKDLTRNQKDIVISYLPLQYSMVKPLSYRSLLTLYNSTNSWVDTIKDDLNGLIEKLDNMNVPVIQDTSRESEV